MKKIGFIGLGIMGRPMAANLLKAGFDLYILDKKSAKVAALAGAGATLAASPKAMAQAVDLIITMLPDTPQVEEVVFGRDGIAEGLSEGLLYIDMSTIAAETEQEIYQTFKKHKGHSLDAPVSGGEPGAINATLSIMVGGDEAMFQKALPVFEALGTKISYMGGSGAGQITKACNQIATALATQGVMEALTLAKKAGMDTAKVRQVMLGGFAQSKALELAGQRMIDRGFEPGFALQLFRKDLRLAQASATSLHMQLTGASLVAAEMDVMIREGKGRLDFSALIQHVEKLSGF